MNDKTTESSKSNVVVPCGTPTQVERAKEHEFRLGPDALDVVPEYKYLGLDIGKLRGCWTSTLQRFIETASAASSRLRHDCGGKLGLRPRAAMRLWDCLVRPILEYACELWSIEMSIDLADQMESIQTAFARAVLGCGSRATDVFVLSEVGRHRLSFRRDRLTLNLWFRLCNTPAHRLLSIVFRHRRELCDLDIARWGWCKAMERLLRRYGLAQSWESVTAVPDAADLAAEIAADAQRISKAAAAQEAIEDPDEKLERALRDQLAEERLPSLQERAWRRMTRRLEATAVQDDYRQKMLAHIGLIPLLDIKPNIGFERYLDDHNNLAGVWLKTRLRSDTLPVMSHLAKLIDWPAHEGACPRCANGTVETRAHFVLECPHNASSRRTFFGMLCARLKRKPDGLPVVDALNELIARGPAGSADLLKVLCGGQVVPRSAGEVPASLTRKAGEIIDRTFRNYLMLTWRERERSCGHIHVIKADGTNPMRIIRDPARDPRLIGLLAI